MADQVGYKFLKQGRSYLCFIKLQSVNLPILSQYWKPKVSQIFFLAKFGSDFEFKLVPNIKKKKVHITEMWLINLFKELQPDDWTVRLWNLKQSIHHPWILLDMTVRVQSKAVSCGIYGAQCENKENCLQYFGFPWGRDFDYRWVPGIFREVKSSLSVRKDYNLTAICEQVV
jgi:hypothetical protein